METATLTMIHTISGGGIGGGGIGGGEVIMDSYGKTWQKINDTGYQRLEDRFYWHMDPRHVNHVMNAMPPTVEDLAYAKIYYK